MPEFIEGPVKHGKFWHVNWDNNRLPTPHETKASATAHFEDLQRKREISQRAVEIDIMSDAQGAGNGPKDLTQISALVRRHEELTLQLFAKQKEIAEIKERIEKIELDTLPNLMMQYSLPKIPVMITPDGTQPGFAYRVDIDVKDVVRASLPTKGALAAADESTREELLHRKAQAFDWLRNHNAEALIKNLLMVTIPKGKDAVVAKIVKLAESLKLPTEREETVHHSTLTKFVRETMESGNPIPFDIFGISTGKKANITNPKLKEEKRNGYQTNDYEE